jgi:hypothetical protein
MPNRNILNLSPFNIALEEKQHARGLNTESLGVRDSKATRRILEEYGALFLASAQVITPPVIVFTSQEHVLSFQSQLSIASAQMADTTIELQQAALEALLEARKEANSEGLDITPRGGSEAARRDYNDTVRLWTSRVLPALEHWTKLERLTDEEAERIRSLSPLDQLERIVELEEQGIFFSKDLKKSIFYSVAPPGTSQHLSMLAFDVTEFKNKRVRQILARHGWFQTVQSDLPHFTYLGIEETELSHNGLKRVDVDGQIFWIPNVLS